MTNSTAAFTTTSQTADSTTFSPQKHRGTLDRVQTAYDLDLLAHARVVLVGTGGARGYAEDLARAGLGEIALIDPDTSSATNVGTQAAYLDEIGLPKVAALETQLRRINPDMTIRTAVCRLEDIDNPAELLVNAWGGTAPRATVLVLATDNFYAHAYGNQLALHYGLPAVAAALYARGEGGEIAYSHPDLTYACLRCVQEARYTAYAEGYRNTTTSHGSPIFAASRLNSLMGMVTMALLHHGSGHPRWGTLLGRMGQRNLLLLKLWPDFDLPGIAQTEANTSTSGLFFDHTVWRPQLPDSPASNGYPACPDCGGTGNLRALTGRAIGPRLQPAPSPATRLEATVYCHDPE